MELNFCRTIFSFCILVCAVTTAPLASLAQDQAALSPPEQPSAADLKNLFEIFPGRWVGNGRLFFKGGKTENVKCRVTYFLSGDSAELKQTIRCASASGKIEVKSLMRHDGKTLSGTWHETIYEMKGALSGKPIKNGLNVRVNGDRLSATMQLLFLKGKQIAEIHFNSETLIGLTLVLKKG